jgi:hypothetical protein
MEACSGRGRMGAQRQGPLLGIQVNLQDIRPAAHPLTARLGNAIVAGKVAGAITLQLSNGRWQDGTGRLILQGSQSIAGLVIGGVRLPPPYL